ncbi:MAG TPA: hypothetical protein VNQ80_12275 [Parapedobacter sp.]|uniref:hypothetical protein n=1 Tax=Parapedobacter sp. TaxID=1958893 RepID=UPI002C37EEDC|nr:hypothetical protein [Parapedobacter sp.]HWK58113.1 hypothetical protein [Parapedobacter sp.]
MEGNYQYTIDILSIVLSALALICTAIIGYSQFVTQKKVDRIQTENGEAILINLVVKYFITFYNSIDKKNAKQATIKTDQHSQLLFLTACEDFRDGLKRLQSSPYFVKLLNIYPDIPMLEYSLVARIGYLKNTHPIPTIDGALYKYMFLLFEKVKTNSSSSLSKLEVINKLYEGLLQLNTQNPQLMK